MHKLLSQGKERPQSLIAQKQSSPDQHAEKDRHEEWLADTHMCRGGAAQIGCQQDRAKNGGPRHDVEGGTGKLDDSNTDSEALGISQPNESLHDSSRLYQFHDAAQE